MRRTQTGQPRVLDHSLKVMGLVLAACVNHTHSTPKFAHTRRYHPQYDVHLITHKQRQVSPASSQGAKKGLTSIFPGQQTLGYIQASMQRAAGAAAAPVADARPTVHYYVWCAFRIVTFLACDSDADSWLFGTGIGSKCFSVISMFSASDIPTSIRGSCYY